MTSTPSNPLKPTVLVIDDSPEVQRYLRFVLEADHYLVETAGNGESGLQRLRMGYVPSLVLLDMQMPGMDGLQTLKCLRELQPQLKVIMCSSQDDPDMIRQAILLGAQAYLVKPVQHLYLSAALERCLANDSPNSPNPLAPVLMMPGEGLGGAN